MLSILKNMWLGVALIGLASAILLISDLDRRETTAKPTRPKSMPRLAVMQWTSTDLLDSSVAGIVEGLRQRGFENGKTASIRFFNAAGDVATANLMAKEVTGGAFDMVLTASTLALQSVASANRDGKIPHVFAAVTDPYGAGVGITGLAPNQHPAYLTGVGTFQPVGAAIQIAHEMNPGLKRLGVVWNPAEDNSDACVRMARAACKERGIELVEANAGNTSEVAEAVRSLLARSVQAIWIGGDTVAMGAINTILSVARDAGIPVFSNDASDGKRGALFGLGASYRQVGIVAGDRGGQILLGADPASFGVENLVPEMLALNETVAAKLKDWTILDEHRKRAQASAPPPSIVQAEKTHTVGLLYFGPNPIFEMASNGVREGLKSAGFEEGRNLVLHSMHANNDISLLPQVIQRLVNMRLDALIVLSTPCLAGAVASVRELPVVFGIVTAPLEAGAGETFDRHLPNVTGAVWTAPVPEAFDWIKHIFPATRRMGIIYNPAHASSRVEATIIRQLCNERGWELVERTLGSSSEISEAMTSLLQAAPDVVFAMGENTVVSGFPTVVDACRKANVPLIADDSSLMGSGALFSIGGSPLSEGRHTGQMAARVLRGERPADIPFEPSVDRETAVDLAAARSLGVEFPRDLLKTADLFHHLSSLRDRPARIALVNLVQSRVLELGEEGLLRGLRESGLIEGVDFTLHRYNAQGEISQLPSLLDAAITQNADLIATLTTPAMLAAANRVRNVPIVFSVSSDPVALGIFGANAIPANLTGVHDDPPVDRLLSMAAEYKPGLKAVGIVYDPAQPNSVLSVMKLRAACTQQGIQMHEATATSMTDLSTAVQSLVQRNAEALLISADNLVCSGFSVVHKTAAASGMPIFTTDIDLMKEGATGAIGDDYESWGAQSGRLAAKVLAGVPPGELPLESTLTQQVFPPKATALAVNSSVMETFGLAHPAEYESRTQEHHED